MKLVIATLISILPIVYIIYYLHGKNENVCQSNYDYPFQDPTLPTDVRLDNLMSLLTPEEKVNVVFISTKISCGSRFED